MAISLAGKIDTATPIRPGSEWQIHGSNRLGLKKYPHCYCTHRALDGMLDLLKANKINPGSVDHVTVSLSHSCQAILRNHLPQTGLEATFSIEFAMASALIAGRAGIAEVTDAFVRRQDVQALMPRVTVIAVDGDDPKHPRYAIHDRVVVITRDGCRLDSGPIRNVRGEPDLPLTREELWAKFEGCVQAGKPGIAARELFDMLTSFDRLSHVSELMALLV